MTNPLIALVEIAAITLLVTLLWAVTLGFAYWDIQRRKQAGQQITTSRLDDGRRFPPIRWTGGLPDRQAIFASLGSRSANDLAGARAA